jgi:SAM-dependent methyltransferase
MNTCAVAIPVYKETFTESERFNVNTSLSNLKNFDVYLYAPQSLDINYYAQEIGITKVMRFPDHCFKSIEDYSRLMLSTEFYEAFSGYSHVLICQPDAIALKPELQYWVDQPYDYLGAPWPKGFEYTIHSEHIHIDEGVMSKTFVGNGGFSLRNIQSCLALFDEFPSVRSEWILHGHAEDLFFGLVSTLSKTFRTPNLMVAACFSHETEPEYLYKLIGNQLPFGCHAYEKHAPEHWQKIFTTQTQPQSQLQPTDVLMTKTLDLGCGPNPNNPFSANEVYGVDIIANLAGNIAAADLALEPIPFPSDHFEFVTAYQFIEHVPRVIYTPTRRNSFVELMNEIHRVLKQDGIFLSVTPAYPHNAAFQDPTHVNIITEETFHFYFSEPTRWASIYGFTGHFRMLKQEWMGVNLVTQLQKI